MGEHEDPDESFLDRLRRTVDGDAPDGKVLHGDDQYATTVGLDGQVIRNLTAEEYAATYADGEPHTLPDDVLQQLPRDEEQGR